MFAVEANGRQHALTEGCGASRRGIIIAAEAPVAYGPAMPVADSHPPASPLAAPPRTYTLLLTLLGLATLALHLANATRYGWFRDEFYYLMCGRRLAWGYVDHPPVIAAIAAFTERVLGGSIAAVRLPVALAHALLVVVAGLMARQFGGGRGAQVLAALAVLAGPVYLGGASTLNMNPIDQLLWSLCLLLMVRAFATDRSPNWLLFGLIAGIGLMTKHSTAFFLAATLAGIVVSPQRRLLFRRGPWMAAAVAALVVSPNIYWEIRQHWPTLEFLRNASAHKNYAASPLEFLSAQALIIGPLSVPLVVAGVIWLLVASGARVFRAIGWGFVAIFALLFAMKAKHYYMAPAYPVVFAAGAVALERMTRRPMLRWLLPAYAVLVVAGGVALVPFTVPLLSPQAIHDYAMSLGLREPQTERHRPARLPQTFADMFGWEELAATVGRVYHALPDSERRHCAVFASNYGEAGALEWFGPRYGLPRIVSGHNNYFLWGPPDSLTNVVITVGEDSSDVAKSLFSVTRAATFSHPWNMPYESDLPILVARRMRAPWRVIWPQTKKYI